MAPLEKHRQPAGSKKQRGRSPAQAFFHALGDQGAKTFTLPEVIIGRDLSCDFILPHELVSARHGRFSFHQNQWWYEDLKSTNGSYLEDLRIEEPIVVKDGDVLFCSEVDVSINIQGKS